MTGVSCVGKTTIGARVAELLGCQFFDLDHEIEDFFDTKIGRLQSRFLTTHSFREEAEGSDPSVEPSEQPGLRDRPSTERADGCLLARRKEGRWNHCRAQ